MMNHKKQVKRNAVGRHKIAWTEARKAIYVDFEGEGKSENDPSPMPHMAGTFVPNTTGTKGTYRAYFFRDEWNPAKNGSRGKADCIEFEEFLSNLIEEAGQGGRLIASWSEYEWNVLKSHACPQSYHELLERAFNARPRARRYANRRKLFGPDDSAAGKSIEEIYQVILPKRGSMPELPIGAAEACRRIDKICEKKQKWKKFTDKQKSYVRELLAYNEGDCRAAWLITKKVSAFYNTQR